MQTINQACFADDTINVASISGGKDSLATWLWAIEHDVKPLAVFADTGHEHPLTMEYLDYLETKFYPIRRVKADFTARIMAKREFVIKVWPVTLVTECGMTDGEADKAIKRALECLIPSGIPFLDLCLWKGRFPSSQRRFCTTELKHLPVRDQLIFPLLDEYSEVINWLGVRAQESKERAQQPVWEEDAGEVRGLNVYRPIHAWTHDEVFAIARRHGIKPNPLYREGFTRVGCFPCVQCNKGELGNAFLRHPEEMSRIAEWERLVSACSRRGNSTFCISTLDPLRAEKDSSKVTVEEYGISSYQDWALTSRGGRQFDLLTAMTDITACSSIYAGVCE